MPSGAAGFTNNCDWPRWRFALIACVCGVVGASVRHMPMPIAEWWLQNWGTSLLYEWMLMAGVLMLIPRRSAVVLVGTGVAVVTIVLEFGQLWQPDWLQVIRGTFVGRMLLGTTFNWWDLPAYPIACALGVGLLLLVWRQNRNSSAPQMNRSNGAAAR